MRLIDVEDSELQRKLKFIREAEHQIYGSGSWGFTAKCEHAIEDAPTVKPEPQIIHCKDCKHWIPYDWMFSEVWQSKNMADYSEDEIGCNYCDMTMKANDFCSRGERREVTK